MSDLPKNKMATTKTTDPRTCCFVCHGGTEAWYEPGDRRIVPAGTLAPAAFLMPRHRDGDECCPAEWLPVCDTHASEWYDDMPIDERLPKIDLARAFL